MGVMMISVDGKTEPKRFLGIGVPIARVEIQEIYCNGTEY